MFYSLSICEPYVQFSQHFKISFACGDYVTSHWTVSSSYNHNNKILLYEQLWSFSVTAITYELLEAGVYVIWIHITVPADNVEIEYTSVQTQTWWQCKHLMLHLSFINKNHLLCNKASPIQLLYG